jgi:calcineurin-like phosphoesterase family protein
MDLSGLRVVGRSVSDYYTADLHLGHVRIPELADRPYPDADAMNEDLTRRWNRTVAPRDTVYVLGDVALGRIADTLPLVARLHGKKILVPGNHDRCHPMNPRAGEWRDRYRDAGFDKILPVNAPVPLPGHARRPGIAVVSSARRWPSNYGCILRGAWGLPRSTTNDH